MQKSKPTSLLRKDYLAAKPLTLPSNKRTISPDKWNKPSETASGEDNTIVQNPPHSEI